MEAERKRLSPDASIEEQRAHERKGFAARLGSTWHKIFNRLRDNDWQFGHTKGQNVIYCSLIVISSIK